MRPPFSAEQFFDVFRRYNVSVWPMQLVLSALALVLVALALTSPRSSRVVVAGLAALWAWMALAYHLAFFAALTPAAYLFGAAFLVEAALLAWHGVRTRRLHFARPVEPTAAVDFGVGEDFGLLPAAILALGVMLWPRARRTHVGTKSKRPLQIAFQERSAHAPPTASSPDGASSCSCAATR